MIKKKTITGWTSKTTSVKDFLVYDDLEELVLTEQTTAIWRYRGSKDSWFKYEYPPKKIKITIEEVE